MMNLSEIGFDANTVLVGRDRCIEVARGFERRAQSLVGKRFVGKQPRDLAEHPGRSLHVALHRDQRRQVQPRSRQIGTVFSEFPECGRRGSEVSAGCQLIGVCGGLSRHDLAFHQRVREGYHDMAAADPDRWVVLDGSGTPDEVAKMVSRAVNAILLQSGDHDAAGKVSV